MAMGEKKMAEHVAALYARLAECRSRYFRDMLSNEEGISRQEEGMILLQAAANFFRVTIVSEIDEPMRANAVESFAQIILHNLSDDSVNPGEIKEIKEEKNVQDVLDQAAQQRDKKQSGFIVVD